MHRNYNYETVSEAVNDLVKRGYTTDFNVHPEGTCIMCGESGTQLSHEEFEIDETYRFDGETDPADEMIVFAISAKHVAMKGILVNAYGMYADTASSKLVERLGKHL